jgi:hypothetical protein
MRSDDRGVDHGVFVVRIIRQRFEKTLPNPFDRPARETRVNVLPGSEARWHVAPRNARPKLPNHRLDEQLIALIAIAPNVSRAAREKHFDPRELVVAQSMAVHLEASFRRLPKNHAFTDSRIQWTEKYYHEFRPDNAAVKLNEDTP